MNMAVTPPSSGPSPAKPFPTWRRLPPAPQRTWSDGITACLFALAFIGVLIGVVEFTQEPDRGIVTDLSYSSGGPGASCSYVGRIMTCRYDIDIDGLDADDAFGDGFDLDAYGCHQVEFRSPYYWFAGSDCVSEEEWNQLEIGDYYPPE